MTAVPSIDLSGFLDEHLSQASPDLLRQMLKTFAQALMAADAEARCGAGYNQRSEDRTNSRNGYRERRWDTRAGTVELAIPKLRSGSYFPEWLLERRKRSEQALVTAVATSYLLGVSTRRMERLVATLGITGLSKSQVSVMAGELDEQVEAFRTRPLDAGPYTFVAAELSFQCGDYGGFNIELQQGVKSCRFFLNRVSQLAHAPVFFIRDNSSVVRQNSFELIYRFLHLNIRQNGS